MTFRLPARVPGKFPIVLTVVLLGAAVDASAQPTFSKVFAPDTIGPGSVSTLTFSITNASGTPVTDLAFTDVLPAGVTIATTSNASTTCVGGTVTAPDGGTTISLTGGGVGAFDSCTVVANVTSSTAGTHMNVSGDLTSSAGNSGPATDDLTVDIDRPGFGKLFVPSSVNLGERSRLSLIIDNVENATQAVNLTFTDPLPTGMVVASPPNASTSCSGGVITAVAGSSTVSYSPAFPGDASVPAGLACDVFVDVVATGAGPLGNITGDLTSVVGGFTTVVSGKASAVLDVTTPTVSLVKEFADDPVAPGDPATLRFTITNFDRGASATGITFNDDLDATLSGLSAVAPLPTNPCGAGSTLTGTSLITLTGGALGPGTSCSFDVPLQVPAGAASGSYLNATGPLTADVGEFPAATDTLFVSAAPELVKEFVDDPVAAGGTATLQFTITNTDTSSTATGLSFTDDLTAVIPGLAPASLPADGFCGAGSSTTIIPGPAIGQLSLSMTGGELAPGASCTFDVPLTVPIGTPNGSYLNTTSEITAIVGEDMRNGAPTSDTLTVVAAPQLTKSFTDDPVQPGSTVTLEFTLTHSPNAAAEATSITFTDDLDAVLTGLVAVGLPANDVCGAGSQISGTNLLTFTGGTLAPGASCSFPVTLQVPAGVAAASYPNTTSDVAASVLGLPVVGPPAVDALLIAGLGLTKEFTDDPAVAGSTVTLSFTLDNASPVSTVTDISFSDDLNSVLPGLAAVGLPATGVCGPGSQLTGTTTLIFSGGSLPSGGSCTFDVTLQVPAATASGEYVNATGPVSATVDGSPTVLPGAADTLIVAEAVLFDKTFVDGAAAPGATTVLEFTITNAHPTDPATGLTFTDDLDAALSGLAAVGLPATDICGAGSQISGTGVLTFTGGGLASGASCTFSVTLQIPAAVSAGTVVNNVTSQLTGTVGGGGVTADPATADLRIEAVTLSKAFGSDAAAGGTVTLDFSFDNLDTTNGVSGVAFSDDLDAVLPGLVATGLPIADACGPGSQISGTSFLTLTGGSLGPGGSCAWSVTLQLPPAVAPGSYVNTTSDVTSGGLLVGAPATATLTVVPPPTFSKSFAPSTVALGGVSTMALSIDNTASTLAATGLAVTDNLPAGMVVATPANAATTCTGGSVTAVSGSAVVSYTGGTVAAGASCTVTVDVAGTAGGILVNTTGELTSSSGSSGAATAPLTVVDAPFVVSKSFSASPVLRGGTVDVEFTITNLSPTTALTEIAFTDDLAAALPGLSATGLPASDVCGSGSALSGITVLSFSGGTLAPGASCTFGTTLAVPSDAPLGMVTNTTSGATALASGVAVTAPEATAGFDVVYLDFSKAFGGSALPGGTVTLSFTIVNPDPVNGASDITFSDDLDAVLTGLEAVALPMSDVCGSGSQISGSSVLTLTGGVLGGAGTCTFDVAVRVPATASAGTYPNVTSPLDAVVGSNPVSGDPTSAAADDLVVAADATAIPTLTGWSLLAFVVLLAATGWIVLRWRA